VRGIDPHPVVDVIQLAHLQVGVSLSEYIRRALAMQVGYERGFDAGRWERQAERT
jgi:hypothetical protein